MDDSKLKESLQKCGMVISEGEDGSLILGFSVERLDELRNMAENNDDGVVFIHITDDDSQPLDTEQTPAYMN